MNKSDTIIYKTFKVKTIRTQRSTLTNVYMSTGRKIFTTETTSQALEIIDNLSITYSKLIESLTKETT